MWKSRKISRAMYQPSTILAMISAIAISLFISYQGNTGAFFSGASHLQLNFAIFFIIGTIITFVLGYLFDIDD